MPTDTHMINFNESTSSIQLMCSLNINIPSSVTVTWLHNSSDVVVTSPNGIITASNTTTLIIAKPQPSDACIYRCVFNDTVGKWTVRRNIILEMLSTYVAINFSYLQSYDLECVATYS